VDKKDEEDEDDDEGAGEGGDGEGEGDDDGQGDVAKCRCDMCLQSRTQDHTRTNSGWPSFSKFVQFLTSTHYAHIIFSSGQRREQLQYDVGPQTMLDMPSWMFTSFAAGKQSYPNNVGHAVLDVFYVFCRLRNLHAQDIVGHAVLDVLFTCPGSAIDFHTQNSVGHAVLDFFTSSADCITLR
jgi:hypothetical protein